MWFVIAYAIYLPFEELVLRFVPNSLYATVRFGPEILLYIVCFFLIAAKNIQTGRWRKSSIDIWLLIFILWWLISMLINHIQLSQAVLALRPLVRYIAVFVIILQSPARIKIRTLLKLVITVGILQAFMGLVQATGIPAVQNFFSPSAVRLGGTIFRIQENAFLGKHVFVSGTMVRYGIYGCFLAFAMTVAFARNAINIRGIFQDKLLLILSVPALVLSFSRKAWIAVALAWLSIQLSAGHLKKTIIVSVSAGIFVGIILLSVGFQPGMRGETTTNPARRFTGMLSPDYLKFSMERTRLYVLTSLSHKLLQTAPIAGLGAGGIGSDVTGTASGTVGLFSPSKIDSLSFNDERLLYVSDAGFVAILGQYGIVGLFILLMIFQKLYRSGKILQKTGKTSDEKIMGLAFSAVVLIMIVENLLGYALVYRVTSYFFWLLAGTTCRYLSSCRKEATGTQILEEAAP